MAEIEIRPAISSDIPGLMTLDHTIISSQIWQIESFSEDEEMNIHLLKSRLPRPLTLSYPKSTSNMADTWTAHDLFLTARINGKLVGYLILSMDFDLLTAQITDLVVDSSVRNQGIASGLILSIRNYLRKNGMRKLMVAAPVRNQAVIALMKKLQMNFCGYIDHYFPNQEAALFYSMVIK
jgi:ribosomal protein S18 acetylase RimI-like enzyme